jgi:hypothetical protein
MTIFVIFNVSAPEQLASALQQEFPRDHLKIPAGEWLVSAQTTSKELCDRLKITNGENGSGIVFSMGSYFGRSDPNIWEWIKVKADPNGA